MKKLFLLIFTGMMLTLCQAQKTDLRLNLEKGKVYKQWTESKATIIQYIEGEKTEMEIILGGSISYLVTKVNDKDYDMDVTYDSLSIYMHLPQGEMEFSSTKEDDEDIFSLILAEMIHAPFQIKMTRLGKVTEVKNIEVLWESAFSQFPDIPESQVEEIKAQLMKAFGEEAFKGSIEMVTAIYPDNPVAIGDSWTIETNLETGMAAMATTVYQFAEADTAYHLIVGVSEIVTADKDAYIEVSGMPVRYDMIGNMSSVIKVDKISGWIMEATIKQDIRGDVYLKENPQLPEGLKIPMIMKNEMVFTNY